MEKNTSTRLAYGQAWGALPSRLKIDMGGTRLLLVVTPMGYWPCML